MNKQDFLKELSRALSGLPREDLEERLAFYSEMIDDRMEDGLSEEEAVADIGSIDEAASQIIADTPLPKLVRERIRPKRKMQTWEIVLLILGFPLWFPLMIAAMVILLSVYIVIWTVIISLWGAEISLIISAAAFFAAFAVRLIQGDPTQALLFLSGALVLTGLSILLFIAFKALTRGAAWLTGKIALGVKGLFLKKQGYNTTEGGSK